MTKKDNDALRRKKNDHFIRAFNYVATARNMKQGELATAIGSKSAYISGYKSGIRPVTDEVIDGLVRESCVEPSQQIYREYLLGNSDIMLLANVTDEELEEVELRRNNPDYDTLQQRIHDSEHNLDAQLSQSLPPSPAIDPSSAVNAAISAYAQLIEAKDAVIADLEARIADLQHTIADKNTIIRDREARITTLEHQLAAAATSDLSRYPFNMGAAEDNKRSTL